MTETNLRSAWRGRGKAGSCGAARRDRPALRGALIALAGILTVGAATAPHWPDWPVLEDLARIVENPLPHVAAAAVLAAVGVARVGAPYIGTAFALVAMLGAGGTVLIRHASFSAPLATQESDDLTMLWINLLWSNSTPPHRLIAALAESPAEIVIVAEAAPLEAHLPELERHFPHQAGCGMPRRCELLVLARQPVEEMALPPMPATRSGRIARVRVARPDGATVTLVGLHLLKPWFGDMADYDDALTMRELARHTGPVVAVGDFNAVPWSRRMQRLAASCDLAWPGLPPSTWPAAAGPFGVPIDLALVRGGAQITAIAPWGGTEIGSDHRGLMMRIGIAEDAGIAAVPDTCRPRAETRRHFGL